MFSVGAVLMSTVWGFLGGCFLCCCWPDSCDVCGFWTVAVYCFGKLRGCCDAWVKNWVFLLLNVSPVLDQPVVMYIDFSWWLWAEYRFSFEYCGWKFSVLIWNNQMGISNCLLWVECSPNGLVTEFKTLGGFCCWLIEYVYMNTMQFDQLWVIWFGVSVILSYVQLLVILLC